MPLTLCVLLWAHDGELDALAAYEDAVLDLVPAYGGRVVSRVRRIDDAPDGPDEVQVIEMPGDDALAAYMADPSRTALTAARDRAIARTQILRTTRVV